MLTSLSSCSAHVCMCLLQPVEPTVPGATRQPAQVPALKPVVHDQITYPGSWLQHAGRAGKCLCARRGEVMVSARALVMVK